VIIHHCPDNWYGHWVSWHSRLWSYCATPPAICASCVLR